MAKGKIRKYRKPLNLNIGMLIFGVILIYVVAYVIIYFQTSYIVRYEVKEGSLATDTIYRGIVLRDETVVYAQTTGYVNYYALEGERVAKNDLVYVVDESGRLSESLSNMGMGENALSERELDEFRSDIVSFAHEFDMKQYGSTYDFKQYLKSNVMKISNTNMLQSIQDLNGAAGINIIHSSYAPVTGIVAYWTDGYEDLTASAVTKEIMEEKEYKKNRIGSNSLMEEGEAVYKLSTNENWSIVIPIDANRGAELQEEGYVKVRFLKNQYESWGATRLLTNGDGDTFLQLSFTNSMITFISDRFLDVELIVEDETGLKIPVSSIVQKEFYLIPEEYIILGGNNGGDSIKRQCVLEDGTISSEIVEIEIYYYDSETKEYYLDSSMVEAGDILYPATESSMGNGAFTGGTMESGTSTGSGNSVGGAVTGSGNSAGEPAGNGAGSNPGGLFTVSRRATLIGVYNMNKGYADFKQISILYQNDEYAIVKPNTKYGLSVYDYIVLNAESVRDDQFINQK